LTKESLDLCCSSNTSEDYFVQVVEALMCTNLMHLEKKEKTKKEKGKNVFYTIITHLIHTSYLI
jgi:hypothetical protein